LSHNLSMHGMVGLLKRTGWFLPLLALLSVSFQPAAHGKNYPSLLVQGLIRLGYPLDREEVIAIDNISMRFDARNRIDVLTRILSDRPTIHATKTGDAFLQTEVICNALRLLDELDLEITRQLIEKLINEQEWRPREQRLLSYMAAKRDIDFNANAGFLISSLSRQRADFEAEWGNEASLAILDTCDNLSFLADLFIYKGDRAILNAMFNYAGQAYGYPKEYLSHMLMEIFLQRPRLFVDILGENDRDRTHVVVNSLIFAIWTNDVKGKVDKLLADELSDENYSANRVVHMLRTRLQSHARPEENSGKPLTGH
jgi:hypothetical protein